nr:hypothetical protein CFP56_11663 [Quercus suber]
MARHCRTQRGRWGYGRQLSRLATRLCKDEIVLEGFPVRLGEDTHVHSLTDVCWSLAWSPGCREPQSFATQRCRPRSVILVAGHIVGHKPGSRRHFNRQAVQGFSLRRLRCIHPASTRHVTTTV